MTYLTPAEAKEQTCPLIQYCVNANAVIQDGASAMHDHPNCYGPDCKMGWRWGDKPATKYFVTRAGGTKEELYNWNPEGAAGYEDAKVRVVEPERRGYCGHFGKPE